MSWTEYYHLLKKYEGNLKRATKKELKNAKQGNPNDPIGAHILAQKKYYKEKYGCEVIGHFHDDDCPNCKFPETIMVRNAETGTLLQEHCSKGCDWIWIAPKETQ